MEQYCLECGAKLIGREDKKFCNDQCRNSYNNKLNRDENTVMTSINRKLRKNRRVLKMLNPNGKAKVRRNELEKSGFNFKYFTHVYKTKGGKDGYC